MVVLLKSSPLAGLTPRSQRRSVRTALARNSDRAGLSTVVDLRLVRRGLTRRDSQRLALAVARLARQPGAVARRSGAAVVGCKMSDAPAVVGEYGW